MMNIREKAKRQNNISVVMTWVFLFCALLCLVCRATGINDTVFITALFFAFSVAFTFVCCKCFLVEYEYMLIEEDGIKYLCVAQIQGKKRIVVCAANLKDIKEIYVTDTGKIRGSIPSAVKKLNYMVTVFPKRYQIVYFSNGSDNISMKIETSETFCNILLSEYNNTKFEITSDGKNGYTAE